MRIRGKEIWWAIATGVLTSLSWAPVGIWPTAFIGPAAFLLVMAHSSRALDRQRRFILHFVFMLSAWALPFHWVALHPIPVTAFTSVLALLAFAMVFAVTMSALPGWLQRRGMGGALLPMILVWSGFDWGLGQTPFAMPWLRLGMAVAPSDWSLFWVGIVGPIGLTLLMLSSAGLFESIRRKHLLRWLLLMVFLVMIGWPSLNSSLKTVNHEEALDQQASLNAPLKLALVQPGWTPETWADIENPDRLEMLAGLISDQLAEADLALFPETSLPPLGTDAAFAAVRNLSESAGVPILAGGIQLDGDGRAWNAAFTSNEAYQKRHLVPFAEYVPFSSFIPFFNAFSVPSGGVEAYEPGDSLELMKVGRASAGILICFESLFLRDGRVYVRNGADLLIVLTQDGWWQSKAARKQHLSFTRLLAAASGVPVAQVSVDGESALIDAVGGVIVSLPAGGPFVELGTLPLHHASTPYRGLGDWIFCLSFLLLAGWGFAFPLIQSRFSDSGTQ